MAGAEEDDGSEGEMVHGTGDWRSGSKQRVDLCVEVVDDGLLEAGSDAVEGVVDEEGSPSKIVDGKLNTYVVAIDHPARLEAKVIVPGNWIEKPVGTMLMLTVSTMVVVPLYVLLAVLDRDFDFELADAPKQPKPRDG